MFGSRLMNNPIRSNYDLAMIVGPIERLAKLP
jgi:hypothetical protein